MIRVALLDSGFAPRHEARVVAARAFRAGDDAAVRAEAAAEGRAEGMSDALAHGPALADVLLEDARVELIVARVFFASLATGAAQLAAALDWATDQGAALVNVSAGLREDREVLGTAVRRALQRGVLVVAASPARGAPVYPAAYPGVVRATGDARCAPDAWSWLASPQADFGAHVRAGEVHGASAACARVCALLAARLAGGTAPASALEELRAQAHYTGREHRLR